VLKSLKGPISLSHKGANKLDKTDTKLLYELCIDLKNMKEMEARHSLERKNEALLMSSKIDSIIKQQAEDKIELLNMIHSEESRATKETGKINVKIAAWTGLIASVFGGVTAFALEYIRK